MASKQGHEGQTRTDEESMRNVTNRKRWRKGGSRGNVRRTVQRGKV